MGWFNHRFCECAACGKQFMLSEGTAKAIYWHCKNDHGMDHEEAFETAGNSVFNNVSESEEIKNSKPGFAM